MGRILVLRTGHNFCWFRYTAMIGQNASAILNAQLDGVSIHRRALSQSGLFHDIHVRFADSVICAGQMADDYLAALGLEMASLDKEVYDEIVRVLRESLDRPDYVDGGYGSQPMLLTEESSPGRPGQNWS